jgi:hypothetical protein
MKFILLIFACFLLASCSGSYYKQPLLLSTKAAAVPSNYKVLGSVETKGCNGMVIYYPYYADYIKMKRVALEQAAAMGGDAVIDFQIRNSSFFFGLFFMSDCYVATGTAVKLKSGGSSWDVSPNGEEKGSSWDSSPLETKEQETKSTWD